MISSAQEPPKAAPTIPACIAIGFWGMATLLVVNCGSLIAQGHSATQATADTLITDAERRTLRLTPDSIWHPIFGFVLPHPGATFTANPDLQRILDQGLAQQPDMAAWGLRDTAQGQTLLIQVTKMGSLDEAGFRRFAVGVRQGLTTSKVVDETLTWPGPSGEYRVTALHPTGLYIGLRCLPRVIPGRFLIVCVQTSGPGRQDLAASRMGLRLVE